MYKQKAANVVKSKMQAKYVNNSLGVSAGHMLNHGIQQSQIHKHDFQYATHSVSSLHSP